MEFPYPARLCSCPPVRPTTAGPAPTSVPAPPGRPAWMGSARSDLRTGTQPAHTNAWPMLFPKPRPRTWNAIDMFKPGLASSMGCPDSPAVLMAPTLRTGRATCGPSSLPLTANAPPACSRPAAPPALRHAPAPPRPPHSVTQETPSASPSVETTGRAQPTACAPRPPMFATRSPQRADRCVEPRATPAVAVP